MKKTILVAASLMALSLSAPAFAEDAVVVDETTIGDDGAAIDDGFVVGDGIGDGGEIIAVGGDVADGDVYTFGGDGPAGDEMLYAMSGAAGDFDAPVESALDVTEALDASDSLNDKIDAAAEDTSAKKIK